MSPRRSEPVQPAQAVPPEYLRLALSPGSGFFINFERLGEAGTRMLHEVVAGDDRELAIAAVRLAAHLRTPGSLRVIEVAARSHDEALREEAAQALLCRGPE